MIHKNSFAARTELIKSGKKETREQMIYNHLYFGRKQMTIRQLLKALYPGSDDMNKVRPRSHDLLTGGALRVCGEAIEGGLPVMVVEVNWPAKAETQQAMF